MSGENNGPDNANEGEGANKGGANGGGDGFKPVTYSTQEELDAAFAERATRAANSAKSEALKAFTDAGVSAEDALAGYAEWKKAEDAKKDPAVLEREKHAQTQQELQRYRDKEAREALGKEVAKDLKIKVGTNELPIPAELLAGTTKEEMTAHGQALIAFIQSLTGQSGPRPPAYNSQQGYSQQDQVATGDPIRNLFMTGQFQ